MKYFFLIVSCCLLLSNRSIASQAPIVRQNGNITVFYLSLNAAISAAQNDDTIYVPGGNYDINGSITIQKRLHLIGAGHNTDSAHASGVTNITGSLKFINLDSASNNASGSTITGIYLSGDILISSGGFNHMNVDNMTISRCNFNSLRGHYDATNYNACCACRVNIHADNYLIKENVIRTGIGGISGSNNFISNNIIDQISYEGNNTVRNNIFLGSFGYAVFGVKNTNFENNIFILPSGTIQNIGGFCLPSIASFCSFTKNIFVENTSSPYCQSCVAINNYVGVVANTIFINQLGNAFSYSHDYHLQNAANYLGTDNTQVGIYGGMFPWKEGSLPKNPHVQISSIASSTDQNGDLQINVKVKAQSK